MKTGTWIRTVEMGREIKDRDFYGKTGQALGAEWWLASQLTALYVHATAPGVRRVPGKERESTFLTRVSRSCVASHRLALRARVEPGKGQPLLFSLTTMPLKPAIFCS